MSKPIDIKALKEQRRTKAKQFLKFKPPEGKTYYAYRIRCLAEPYEVVNRRFGTTETHVQVELLDAINDDTVEIGEVYIVNLQHAVLRRLLEDHRPLKGKVFDVMNRGKIRGKRSTYVDYAVILQEGELNVDRLVASVFRE